jgi:hypothetical protein
MVNRTLLMACLIAALAACERPQETSAASATVRNPIPPAVEQHSISAAPEHFDRVRAEQFEKEEDRLRKRSRN